ncbi:Flp pilus assembly protein CpaB [Luedemannella helvata]|uniref:Flp pilus assembly protein RcpC/CpaB domain-containing protein n=1 Tax=Luedemannella helvata TaxID=349315 RepID=A0ABP4VR53_9ACTN
MTRRLLAIAVAIVLAAFGTAAVLYYAFSADTRAQDRISNPVTVAVADQVIPAGTSGATIRSRKLVRFEKMPKDAVPSDALSEISVDQDKLVVTSNIAAGQVLMAANFGSQSQIANGLALPSGSLAVTVETGAPEQVAGYVRPGSEISIFLTYKVVDSNGDPTKITRTRVLLPKVEVLAVGTYTPNGGGGNANDPTAGGGSGSLLVTVAVNQAEAERLIQGLNVGSLYLGLLGDSTDVKAGSGVDNRDSGAGSTPIFR